ncbi:putative membrane protein [Agrobacterium sp. RAC06]|nr:putative membrane protein [Agrobacterium sp. RAC06]
MLALLIASAIAASLLIELGLMVARDWMELSHWTAKMNGR